MAENKVKKKRKDMKPIEKWFRFLNKAEKVVRLVLPHKVYYAMPREEYGDGAYILVGNHYSVWDVKFPILFFPNRPVHFMAKQELWEGSKFMHWFVVKSECIPVSRDGSGTDVKAIMQAMRYVKNGELINIFPEGRRNTENVDMLPFKGGSAAISIKTKTPILPFVQVRKLRPFHKSEVICGKPMEFTEYYGKKLTEEDIQICEDRLRNEMIKMRADFLAEKEAKKKKKKK
ncbi:MAG: 1-acyl-sn-glycerol-3-phosphate acyltransferase [Clostridia bacterium]|nr:1-acyl-sn-glycerol-3-phosphate acyltransferase [Clostridia bacterium]